MYILYACVYSAYKGNLYICLQAYMYMYMCIYQMITHPPTHPPTHLLPQWVNPEKSLSI